MLSQEPVSSPNSSTTSRTGRAKTSAKTFVLALRGGRARADRRPGLQVPAGSWRLGPPNRPHFWKRAALQWRERSPLRNPPPVGPSPAGPLPSPGDGVGAGRWGDPQSGNEAKGTDGAIKGAATCLAIAAGSLVPARPPGQRLCTGLIGLQRTREGGLQGRRPRGALTAGGGPAGGGGGGGGRAPRVLARGGEGRGPVACDPSATLRADQQAPGEAAAARRAGPSRVGRCAGGPAGVTLFRPPNRPL